jgi:hypothetical protein
MPPVDAFSPVYLQFATVAGTWYATLFDYANQLFLMLATIESGLGAIQWMVAQQSHDYVAMGLFRKILWIGFMYAMLLNAHTWIPAVISSFVQAGREASGIRGLNPAEIFHSRGQKCRRADAGESRSIPPETAERNRRGRMKTTIQHLRQFGQKALALGRYLHGDSVRKQPAHRYDTIAEQSGGSSRG